MKTYIVEYLEKVVKKEIPNLPSGIRERVQVAISTKLTVNPVEFGKPLQYELKGYRRLRIGDYRVVYRIEGNTVLVVAIKHRKEIYD
mgnify:CR=1 FL=1